MHLAEVRVCKALESVFIIIGGIELADSKQGYDRDRYDNGAGRDDPPAAVLAEFPLLAPFFQGCSAFILCDVVLDILVVLAEGVHEFRVTVGELDPSRLTVDLWF
ncbi:MAG: hypothetical protein IJ128_01040, partial [Firmicutes bacterium]|nr:hypothetical protein [Bacillota bacterium]